MLDYAASGALLFGDPTRGLLRGRSIIEFTTGTPAEAREAWKSLAARDDVERNYWKQDDNGRWSKAA